MTNPEDIPQANSLFFTLKLVSGDELLCVMIDDDGDGIMIEDPIIIRLIPVMIEDEISTKVSSSPYMPFAAQRIFYISHADIISLMPMHSQYHQMYANIVNQYLQRPVDDIQQPRSSSTIMDPIDTIQ